MREPFKLARGVVTEIGQIVVELIDEQGRTGRGEAPGLPYEGETPASMSAQLARLPDPLSADLTPENVQRLLPRGGARNALDCALWDLLAKRSGKRAWELAGLTEVHPVTTGITLGIDDDEPFRRRVRAVRHMPIIKIKNDRSRNVDLVRIAREEHADALISVDANQSWDRELLDALTPQLRALGVRLIEQPVPVGADEQLRGYRGIDLAADESCTDSASVDRLRDHYQFVSIKLDKCGGLTDGLAIARKARSMGLGLMVGNMGGTSLSTAAHFVIAQLCDYVDLDAPLIFRGDREHPLRYDGAVMQPPDRELWG